MPLWRLPASDNGPTVIALLQSHLYESELRLPASILNEHIGHDLEILRPSCFFVSRPEETSDKKPC